MEIDYISGASFQCPVMWTTYSRKPDQRYVQQQRFEGSVAHRNLLTFGGNRHGERALNMGTSCSNGEATFKAPGKLCCITIASAKQCLYKSEPAKQILKPNLHPQKILITVWRTNKSVAYYEFLPRDQTINMDVYHRQLNECLRKLLASNNQHWSISQVPYSYMMELDSVASKRFRSWGMSFCGTHLIPQFDRCVRDKQFPKQDALI
ncbi:hypothetical protein TNIN_194211 [Trichonephila inaurata madagascariensis]|uniref:Uncharacterized protein n=1 Tax=Trichonephila inaurata madagascariensis TaxID=2747483 RepID=A0A8X6X7E9_9ARAC|nr:hypothetical protein TNIN_194211 [Trichonephila inaurata madagascariensis]